MGEAKLEIFNALGEVIKSFTLTNPGKGKIEWDGLNQGGIIQPSGVYIMRLSVGYKAIMIKSLLIK